jgi:hypothetical protein
MPGLLTTAQANRPDLFAGWLLGVCGRPGSDLGSAAKLRQSGIDGLLEFAAGGQLLSGGIQTIGFHRGPADEGDQHCDSNAIFAFHIS